MQSLTPRDLSQIAYAYSSRNLGNPELHQAFEKRLLQYTDSKEYFDYPTMHNLIYYLIFKDNTNKKIWKYIVDSTVNEDETLPIVYYKPFKHSKYYLKHHFKDWDLRDYIDKFYYAEQKFNQVS